MGSLCGGFLYGVGGWHLPLACTAVLHLSCGALVWALAAQTLRHPPRSLSPGTPSAEPVRTRPLRAYLCTRRYVLPAAAMLLGAIANVGPLPVLPQHWSRLGLSVEGIGLLQVPPPLLPDPRPCQNNRRCCCRHFWHHGIWPFLFLVVGEGQPPSNRRRLPFNRRRSPSNRRRLPSSSL